MRVTLVTDTLGDVNGVCRFIQSMARCALESGRDLDVVTSTRRTVPPWPNVRNYAPVASMPLPGYDHLSLVWPPVRRMIRDLRRRRPDVVHVSTPGPVGLAGYAAARLMRVPVVGVYHTDFPAYVDRLFGDEGMTALTRWFMRRLYSTFCAVLTRSEAYVPAVEALGIPRRRVRAVRPGVDTRAFHPEHRDERVWERVCGPDGGAVRIVYVGRVSVEKNMPFLVRVWERVWGRTGGRGIRLVIVGDGPWRGEMERLLSGRGVVFTGYRHGQELSALYAGADLFVFPSTTDTLGQVVMEAQASGVACLVACEGGPKEIVRDGVTGRVLPVCVETWAEAIVGLARDESARRAMGRAGHDLMREFTPERSFASFWSAHEAASAGARKRRDPRAAALRGW